MKQLTIRMKADDVAEILLYDQIGADDFFGGGVSAKDFRAQIKALKAKSLNLRVNSPGGSVTEGAAMLVALDEFPGRIEVDIDGVAASAASVVAMAGDHIRVAQNGLVMIHNPYTVAAGGAEDMRRTADLLDKVKGQILDAYSRHSKLGKKELARMMDEETWLTGAEAVAAGLAHEATGAVKVAALAAHRPALARLKYRHVPEALKAQAENPYTFEVGDIVEWLVEDAAGLCAEMEDGVIEEMSAGTLSIPGTGLSLTGTADDPAVRVIDADSDETCWYLVRASQLREQEEDSVLEPRPGYAGMPGMSADAWAETERRRAALKALGEDHA